MAHGRSRFILFSSCPSAALFMTGGTGDSAQRPTTPTVYHLRPSGRPCLALVVSSFLCFWLGFFITVLEGVYQECLFSGKCSLAFGARGWPFVESSRTGIIVFNDGSRMFIVFFFGDWEMKFIRGIPRVRVGLRGWGSRMMSVTYFDVFLSRATSSSSFRRSSSLILSMYAQA